MYVEQYLVKERQRERLKRAEQVQLSRQLVQMRKLRKRQERAERKLLDAWQRVEQLRSVMSTG